jgi:hypothetical protein
MTKVCFKCKVEKPLTEFYKHKQMGDGHLNKCKDCTKKDVKEKYSENIENPEYAEKERERGREKYRRLGYSSRPRAHIENSNSSRFLKKRGVNLEGLEIHHWNYNLEYDVFLLDRREHSLIHKYLIFDEDTKMFFANDILLDTKEKHKEFLATIIDKSKIQEFKP